MSWFLLILAGLLEVCWAVGLKYTHGFTRLIPSCLVMAAIIGSMGLLALAVRNLPVGPAYAIWVSIGIVGVALAQPVFFHEPIRPVQIFFLILLVVAIIGLKLSSPAG